MHKKGIYSNKKKKKQIFSRPYNKKIRSSIKEWVPAFRNRLVGPRLVVWPVAAWLGESRGGEESAGRARRATTPPICVSIDERCRRRLPTSLARAACSGPSAPRAATTSTARSVPSPSSLSQPLLPLVKRPGGIQPRGRRLSPYYTYGPGLFFYTFFFYVHAFFSIFLFFPIFFPAIYF